MTSTTFGHKKCLDKWGAVQRIKNKLKRKFPLSKKIKDDLLLLCSYFFLHLNVISSKEIEKIKKIRCYRNKLAHELINFMIDSDFEVELNYLFQIKEIIIKIDLWWVKEIEIPINPDFDGLEIDKKEITTGNMILLNHLISIVFINKIIKEKIRWHFVDVWSIILNLRNLNI